MKEIQQYQVTVTLKLEVSLVNLESPTQTSSLIFLLVLHLSLGPIEQPQWTTQSPWCILVTLVSNVRLKDDLLWCLALTGVHHYLLSLNLLPSRSCVCGYKMCLTAQTFCRQNCWNCTVCVRKQPGLFLQILPQLSPRDDRPSWNPWIRVFAISTWESSFSTFFFEVMSHQIFRNYDLYAATPIFMFWFHLS